MSKVFISYSHKDEVWKDRVASHLGVLVEEGRLEVWEDRRIDAGDDWFPEIETAIQTCHAALLLVSVDFLNSQFIRKEEVARLLERRIKDGVRVIPVIVRPCVWQHVSWLKGIQARPKDGKPLTSMSENAAEEALAALAEELLKLLGPSSAMVQQTVSHFVPPDKISLANLPQTEGEQDRALLKVAQTLAKLVGGAPKAKLDTTIAEPPAHVGTAAAPISYTLTELLRRLVRIKETFERCEAVGAPRTSETLEPVWAEIMALRRVADLTPMDQFSRDMMHECINDLVAVHRKHALALAHPAEAQDALPEAREALERFLAPNSGHLDRLRARFAVLQGGVSPPITLSVRRRLDELLGEAFNAGFEGNWGVPPPGADWERLDGSYDRLNRYYETSRSCIVADEILTRLLNQSIAYLDLFRKNIRKVHYPGSPEWLVNSARLAAAEEWKHFKEAREKTIERMQEICPDLGGENGTQEPSPTAGTKEEAVTGPNASKPVRPDEGQAGHLEFRPLDAATGGSQASPAETVFGERAVARDTCKRLTRSTANACEALLDSPSRQTIAALDEQFEPLFKFSQTQRHLLDTATQEQLWRGIDSLAELLADTALGIDPADIEWRQKAHRFIDAARKIGGA